MKRSLFVLSLVTLLAGCSNLSHIPPSNHNVENTKHFDLPVAKVWDGVIEWYALKGIPIRNIEKESGLISSEYGMAVANGLDCGKAEGNFGVLPAQLENIQANINTIVRKGQGNTTRVVVNVFGHANVVIRDGLGNLRGSMGAKCVSNGAIEQSLLSSLRN